MLFRVRIYKMNITTKKKKCNYFRKVLFVLIVLFLSIINFFCAYVYTIWLTLLIYSNVSSLVVLFISLLVLFTALFTVIPIWIYLKTNNKKRFWKWFIISYFVFIILTFFLAIRFTGI